MLLNLINKYTDLAVNSYHVDPRIFVGLIILSLPFFYGSFFVITKQLFNYKKRKNFDNRKLGGAILVCFISYIFPYFYIILFGKDLPMWFWVFMGVIIFFAMVSFIRKVVGPVRTAKKGEGK
jgi:hypothetical protein